MSLFAAKTTLRRLKANNGIHQGLPRIYNIDRDTYSYGYAEVNTQAASPFVRTKVHDGRFEGTSDVTDGDLIRDRVDNSVYLAMSIKGIYGGGSDGAYAYKDGTLYLCNTTATIKRLDEVAEDVYGRPTTGFVNVATGVYIMVNAQNFSTGDYQETLAQDNKIKVVLQSKNNVKLADRIETAQGDVLVIENIDKSSLTNLWICYCNTDVR